jgi:hypothetical protein
MNPIKSGIKYLVWPLQPEYWDPTQSIYCLAYVEVTKMSKDDKTKISDKPSKVY